MTTPRESAIELAVEKYQEAARNCCEHCGKMALDETRVVAFKHGYLAAGKDLTAMRERAERAEAERARVDRLEKDLAHEALFRKAAMQSIATLEAVVKKYEQAFNELEPRVSVTGSMIIRQALADGKKTKEGI